MSDDIRVMVVDDAVIYRKVLSEIINDIPGFKVMATAANGRIALDKIALKPYDLVLLDMDMPVLDGPATCALLKADHPEIGVIIVSGSSRRDAQRAFSAIASGAIECVQKPTGRHSVDGREALKRSLGPLLKAFLTRQRLRGLTGRSGGLEKRLTQKPRLVRGTPAPLSAQAALASKVKPARLAAPARARSMRGRKPKILAIGISTGGPSALDKVIPLLPENLPVPVVIVQHMPPNFTAALADRLDRRSNLHVFEGYEGAEVKPGVVIIAPGGKHMEVRRVDGKLVVHVHDGEPVKSCRPSVDVLFNSISDLGDVPALAVIMTGMGDDGCNGTRILHEQGARVLAQSEETCVVYGMPRAVAEAGLPDEVVDLDDMASRMTSILTIGI